MESNVHLQPERTWYMKEDDLGKTKSKTFKKGKILA